MTKTLFSSLVVPVCIVVLLIAVGVEFASVHYVADRDGAVLVVINSASPTDFSKQVLDGVAKAQNVLELRRLPAPTTVTVDIKTVDTNAQNGSAYYHTCRVLAKEIARHRVLGVISSCTSLTEKPVIEICRSLKIPLLIAVASNDQLLSANTAGIVFRLLPNNSEQVREIALWASKYQAVAVFHESNDYGDFLFDRLAAQMQREGRRYYSFPVSQYTEFATLLPNLRTYQLDSCVFLGYSTRAADLLDKMERSGLKLPILLSDGSFSVDLQSAIRNYSFPVSLCFPTDPGMNGVGLKGFGTYGYDGYLLLSRLRREAPSRHRPLASDAFRVIAGEGSQGGTDAGNPLHGYSFDAVGEPSGARFAVIPAPGRFP